MVHEFYIDMDNPMISESSSKADDGDETTPTTTATEDTVVNHTATREIATVSSTTDPIGSETFTCIITDMTDPSNSCKRHVINLSSKYTLEDLIQEAGTHYAYDPFTFCLMWKCPTGDMINVSEIQANNLNLAHLGLKVTLKQSSSHFTFLYSIYHVLELGFFENTDKIEEYINIFSVSS